MTMSIGKRTELDTYQHIYRHIYAHRTTYKDVNTCIGHMLSQILSCKALIDIYQI